MTAVRERSATPQLFCGGVEGHVIRISTDGTHWVYWLVASLLMGEQTLIRV
jgi:hypothetical protein